MSPLELFRRNQKVMMTGLILLSMFAFVVLPAMTSYLQKAGPGVSDPVLATFNGVDLKRSRIVVFTRMHNQTVRFLEALAEKTMELGGSPQVPGFQYDPRTQQIRSLGINQQPSELGSIRTLQFAAAAEEAGFELDDTAIENWLMSFSAEKMTQQQIMGILAKETQNGMGEYHLYDMLRSQLLARVYENGASAALSYGQMPILTPAEQWQNFLKLNQKASGDAYGILVSEFLDQTDADPSEARIRAVYDAGKEYFPNAQSPDPGFRKRDTATIEYLAGNLQKFVDAEVAKLSEEEIREEYDRQVAGGDFQLPKEKEKSAEEPQDAETEPADTTPAAAPVMTEEKPAAEAKPETDAKPEPETAPEKVEETEEDSKKESADEIAKQRKQVEDFQKEIEAAREADLTVEEPPAEKPAEAKPETEEPATETVPSEKPDADDQSSIRLDSAVQLVVFQDDDEEKKASEKASETAETPAKETATEEKASTDKEDADAAAAPSDNTETDNTETVEEPASEEAPPEVKSYEDVRVDVAEAMVQNDARVALDRALTKARKAMKVYFALRSRYVMSKDESQKPERPDLKAMAKELGLSYEKIGPHTVVSISDEPISESVEVGSSFNQRGFPFPAMMFGAGNQLPKLELFKSLSTVDIPKGLSYLSWKVEETESSVPPLDEVRNEVVTAVRMEDARELARKAAEDLAEQVTGDKTLADVVPQDKKENLKANVAPFSWMNSFGFGRATLGNVEELDSVGEEFMSSVFNAAEDEVVVAANLPQTVVYVFDRSQLQPATQDLRSIFKQPQERMKALSLGVEDRYELRQGFIEMIDEKTGLVLNAEPE